MHKNKILPFFGYLLGFFYGLATICVPVMTSSYIRHYKIPQDGYVIKALASEPFMRYLFSHCLGIPLLALSFIMIHARYKKKSTYALRAKIIAALLGCQFSGIALGLALSALCGHPVPILHAPARAPIEMVSSPIQRVPPCLKTPDSELISRENLESEQADTVKSTDDSDEK